MSQSFDMPDQISICGPWSVTLQSGADKQTHTIDLPGSLQERDFGALPTAKGPWTEQLAEGFPKWEKMHPDIPMQKGDVFRCPFSLTPRRKYVGIAKFERMITIPESWAGQRVVLHLERPHWKTTVWVDDQEIGSCDSLSTPHEYEIFYHANPGEYRLRVDVDNRVTDINPGQNSHSISDHTQGNWNGIVGAMELRATPAVYVKEIEAYPSAARFEVKMIVRVASAAMKPQEGCTVRVGTQTKTITLKPGETLDLTFIARIPEFDAKWDEFNPRLHKLSASISIGDSFHQQSITVGLRDLAITNKQITLNNQPIYLRGTLECCIFPLTGYPPTDLESWRRIVRICKAHGLNHIRFHSWCPPEAAFVAADEMGFYYQIECSSWANQGSTVGDDHPLDHWLYEEAERIIRAYGNHPSFMLMCYGNEPAGKHHKEYLTRFIEHFRQRDPRHLYTSAAGWPTLPASDYDSEHSPRLHQWGDGLKSTLNAEPPHTMRDFSAIVQKHDHPIISHEIGQWCVFPNLDERAKYTGFMQPRNFDLFEELLEQKHQRDLAPAFLHASGKLQALCYKEEIEAALRTPGFGGFQLLDLHDFPGQGTALVGVLDPFWDEKGYITAQEFRQFCGPIVPLVRLPQRVYESNQMLRAELELYHFGPRPLPDATISWSIRQGARVIGKGQFTGIDLANGKLQKIGMIECALSSVTTPGRVDLSVQVERSDAMNLWDVWVYPASTAPAEKTTITTNITDAIARAEQGETVILSVPAKDVRNDPAHPLVAGFSSIFWNTAWTNNQPPHTLGILCDPAHASLKHFPTSSHTDWQWWELVHNVQPMILDSLPKDVRPIVHMIDDWFTCRRLGLIIEARVGQGKLLLTSIDLTSNLDKRPVARQLAQSLQSYVQSSDFKPAESLTREQLAKVVQFES